MIVVWDISSYIQLIKGPKNKWQQVRAKEVTPVLVPVAATLENYPCTSKRIEWTPNSVEVIITQLLIASIGLNIMAHPAIEFSFQIKGRRESQPTKTYGNSTVVTMDS